MNFLGDQQRLPGCCRTYGYRTDRIMHRSLSSGARVTACAFCPEGHQTVRYGSGSPRATIPTPSFPTDLPGASTGPCRGAPMRRFRALSGIGRPCVRSSADTGAEHRSRDPANSGQGGFLTIPDTGQRSADRCGARGRFRQA